MYDLPVVFHFKVEVAGFDGDDNKFQEVSGLNAEVTTEEIREGGENNFSYRLPTGTKYGNLVLKRGYFNSSGLGDWCREAIQDFQFTPRDVKVTLLDKDHNDLANWNFKNAYPVKWSISDFKAQDNALLIESIELAYLYFRKG